MNFIYNAHDIAQRSLRSCMTTHGIIAGPHHFIDFWARDTLFATFGLLKKDDLPITKATIEIFLHNQRYDGLIPYIVMRSRLTIGKYVGKPSYLDIPKAHFRSHQSGGLVPDGGLLVVIASAMYYSRSHDVSFVLQNYEAISQGLDWYERRFHGNLIHEWFQCEWADGVLKAGNVLYTNVLYMKALRDMVHLASVVGNKKDVKRFTRIADIVHSSFLKVFWNGKFLSDWVDYSRHDYFASHANFLAILFDLVDAKQAASILLTAEKYSVHDFTVENNYPKYPFWRIPLIQHCIGMADYHNRGCLWLQPGILYTLALWKCGNKVKARAFLEKIADQIVKYNGVYEVYEKNGVPVRRLFYRSEGPFAWSAGLFLWACDVIQ